MRIVICALNSKYVHSSLAPWYLKAAIGDAAECVVVEGTINEQIDTLMDRILAVSPEVVAFSTYIWNLNYVIQLAKRLKSAHGIKIMLGGAEVSYNVPEIFEKYSFVDYVISGEGEMPILQFCKGIPFEEIVGFCYRKGDDVSIKPPIVSFCDPPNPYTKEYLEALNGRISYIETSRGCPFRCAFCLSGRCGGVRFFDLEESEERILVLANSGTQTVKFIDRTFNANKERAKELFSFILERYGAEIPVGVCFHFEIEGELLDKETLEILKKAPIGLFQFEIGLQSTNAETLEAINRKCNFDRLRENVKDVIELGNIHTHLDLIAGLPYEDFKSFKNSFNLAYAIRPHMLQLGFLKLLHGTEMRDMANQYDYVFSDTPPYEIISNKWISDQELEELHSFEDVFEKMYNSRRFGLTCEYLSNVLEDAFEMYFGFSKTVKESKETNSLDGFTRAVFDYFSSLKQVDSEILRDKLALDRLATNRMGALPEFLKIKSPNLKKTLNLLEREESTSSKKNVKRYATALLTRNQIAYVDYDVRNPVTNRYSVRFAKLFDE